MLAITTIRLTAMKSDIKVIGHLQRILKGTRHSCGRVNNKIVKAIILNHSDKYRMGNGGGKTNKHTSASIYLEIQGSSC